MPATSPSAIGASMQQAANLLGCYLARRDILALTQQALGQAGVAPGEGVLVVLCSAVLDTVRLAAQTWQRGLWGRILLSGGVGHSTALLRRAVASHPIYGPAAAGLPDASCTEAGIFAHLLTHCWKVPSAALLVEDRSTNCGENAAYSAQLLRSENRSPLVLMQDPTMQQRTHYSFRQFLPQARLISFAPFIPQVDAALNPLPFGQSPWSRERYLSLLMGEIPRLRDDKDGYGPKGKGFIPHVDIPQPVLQAYLLLKQELPSSGRAALG